MYRYKNIRICKYTQNISMYINILNYYYIPPLPPPLRVRVLGIHRGSRGHGWLRLGILVRMWLGRGPWNSSMYV